MNAMKLFAGWLSPANRLRKLHLARPLAGVAWRATAGFIAAAGAAHAQVTFHVSFDDPGASHEAYYGPVRQNIRAAGDEWAGYLGAGSKAALQVVVSFEDIPTASSGSVANRNVGQHDGYSLHEQGASYEIRTGQDPNGKAPDIHIALGSSGYLQNELWFDPSPARQVAPVPTDRTDARSLFLHELGHAFAFNGWRDGVTGALAGRYESTFDAWVQPLILGGQSVLAFAGPSASSLYGGPIPLTVDRYAHLGNEAPVPGNDLIPDLMNGVSFARGTRYHITPIDLAILRDAASVVPAGAADLRAEPFAAMTLQAPPPNAVPEPSTWLLTLAGLAIVVVIKKRQSLSGSLGHEPQRQQSGSEQHPRLRLRSA